MLWDESALDSALMDEGLSEPCKAFVQHTHVCHVLLCFFAGDFPGSHARIPRDAWLAEILLQVAFFFIPGTFCEIFPPRPAYIQPAPARVRAGGATPTGAPPSRLPRGSLRRETTRGTQSTSAKRATHPPSPTRLAR